MNNYMNKLPSYSRKFQVGLRPYDAGNLLLRANKEIDEGDITTATICFLSYSCCVRNRVLWGSYGISCGLGPKGFYDNVYSYEHH